MTGVVFLSFGGDTLFSAVICNLPARKEITRPAFPDSIKPVESIHIAEKVFLDIVWGGLHISCNG